MKKNGILLSEQEKLLKETYETQLNKARNTGISIGAKSVSKVIYEKAVDPNKTDSEKIVDIIEFCKTGLAIKDNS